MGTKWRKNTDSISSILLIFLISSAIVSADRALMNHNPSVSIDETSYVKKVLGFLWQSDGSGYQHVWPPMELGWKIVVGSVIGFFGAALGSVGGVGGGGIFVPMLALIIGFDPKSSTAMSKCKRS